MIDRSISRRYVWLAELRVSLESDWSIAFPESDTETDRPFSLDALGNAWVPPTSVAGALRSHLLGLGGPIDLATKWMAGTGTTDDDDRAADDGEAPVFGSSRLRIIGTAFESDVGLATVRQTAIDEWSAAAKGHTLRSSQVVEKGAVLRIFLRSDGDDQTEFDELAESLASWTPILGSGRTVGRGRGRLTKFSTRTLDLAMREDLAAWFDFGGPGSFEDLPDDVEITAQAESVALERKFVTVDPLLLGGGERQVDPSLQKLRTTSAGFVLRGTELKGVMRHRAGFILRSLGVADGDVTAVQSYWFGRDTRRGRLLFADAKVDGGGGREPRTSNRTHVSLDRFTGGAAPHRLYSVECIDHGRFTIAVSDGRPTDAGWPEFNNLLNWITFDIAEGYVGLGAATSRGYGTVQPESGRLDRPEPLTESVLADIVATAARHLDDEPAASGAQTDGVVG